MINQIAFQQLVWRWEDVIDWNGLQNDMESPAIASGRTRVMPSKKFKGHEDNIHCCTWSSDGELILLAAETYLEGEPIDLDGKLITLRGALDKSGGPATILDGAGTHTVLVAESGETTATVLENLVVQNGLASMWSVDDVDSNYHGYANGGGLFMYPQALDGDAPAGDEAVEKGRLAHPHVHQRPHLLPLQLRRLRLHSYRTHRLEYRSA